LFAEVLEKVISECNSRVEKQKRMMAKKTITESGWFQSWSLSRDHFDMCHSEPRWPRQRGLTRERDSRGSL